MNKQQIKDNVENPGIDSFEGSVDEIMARLLRLKTAYGDGVEIVWQYGWNDFKEPAVYVSRLETDEEFHKRVQAESASAASKEAAERAQFERLRKKYE